MWGRIVAALIGAAMAGAALYITLSDAIASGRWTTEHLVMPIVMLGVIYCGRQVAAEPNWISKLGFLLGALAATAVMLIIGVGRQGEAAATIGGSVEFNNAERITETEQLRRNRQRLSEAQDKLPGCVYRTGECDRVNATISVYDRAVEGSLSRLSKLPPARPVDATADQVVQVVRLFGGPDKLAREVLSAVRPWLLNLLFELLAVLAFHVAFRPSKSAARTTLNRDGQTDGRTTLNRDGQRLNNVIVLPNRTTVEPQWASLMGMAKNDVVLASQSELVAQLGFSSRRTLGRWLDSQVALGRLTYATTRSGTTIRIIQTQLVKPN